MCNNSGSATPMHAHYSLLIQHHRGGRNHATNMLPNSYNPTPTTSTPLHPSSAHDTSARSPAPSTYPRTLTSILRAHKILCVQSHGPRRVHPACTFNRAGRQNTVVSIHHLLPPTLRCFQFGCMRLPFSTIPQSKHSPFHIHPTLLFCVQQTEQGTTFTASPKRASPHPSHPAAYHRIQRDTATPYVAHAKLVSTPTALCAAMLTPLVHYHATSASPRTPPRHLLNFYHPM